MLLRVSGIMTSEAAELTEMLPNLLDEYAHKQEHAKLMKLKAEVHIRRSKGSQSSSRSPSILD